MNFRKERKKKMFKKFLASALFASVLVIGSSACCQTIEGKSASQDITPAKSTCLCGKDCKKADKSLCKKTCDKSCSKQENKAGCKKGGCDKSAQKMTGCKKGGCDKAAQNSGCKKSSAQAKCQKGGCGK